MLEKKELNDEELEQVTGGASFASPLCIEDFLIVHYRDTIDGEVQYHDLGMVYPNDKAEEWCIANNKIYDGFHRSGQQDTNTYEAQQLLTSLY